jgi:hypothetical protein
LLEEQLSGPENITVVTRTVCRPDNIIIVRRHLSGPENITVD